MLGPLTTLAVLSEDPNGFLADLQGSRDVGPLSGKTTLAVIAWAVVWGGLHLAGGPVTSS